MIEAAQGPTSDADRPVPSANLAGPILPTDVELLAMPFEDLLERARELRAGRYGTRVTYSPEVFLPLTMLCQDRCGYCTFATPPARLSSAYLSTEDVLAIARAGVAAGCHEALFTLGERPELRYPGASEWLARHGFTSTVDYLAECCRL